MGGRTPHTRGDRRSECPVAGTLLVRCVGYGPLHRGAPVVTAVVQHLDASPPVRRGNSVRQEPRPRRQRLPQETKRSTRGITAGDRTRSEAGVDALHRGTTWMRAKRFEAILEVRICDRDFC
jgi:hypothetical protein